VLCPNALLLSPPARLYTWKCLQLEPHASVPCNSACVAQVRLRHVQAVLCCAEPWHLTAPQNADQLLSPPAMFRCGCGVRRSLSAPSTSQPCRPRPCPQAPLQASASRQHHPSRTTRPPLPSQPAAYSAAAGTSLATTPQRRCLHSLRQLPQCPAAGSSSRGRGRVSAGGTCA
jgi:hypothetical protein